MHVDIVDPSAYTPPYDHALCEALAQVGADVRLVTSRFVYGPVAPATGYQRRELFYRAARGAPASRRRRLVKLAQHVPDMLRYRDQVAGPGGPDVVHFQWLTVPHLDGLLLPRRRCAGGSRRALVLTAHDVMPREPRLGQLSAQRRLYHRFDAIVVHSEHGRARLIEQGVGPSRLHVIPHGALLHLARGGPEPPPFATDRPVVLCFGLMRPYKGLDLLVEAWKGIAEAELWIVGMPRMDITPLRSAVDAINRAAQVQERRGPRSPAATQGRVRLVPRFITDDQLPAYFAAADLVVLPYREIDQSGVLFTALAFGKPLLLTDVGGFGDVAAAGAARLVPPGDPHALHEALAQLLGDREQLVTLSDGARAAAAGPYAWEEIARAHLRLYSDLMAGNA